MFRWKRFYFETFQAFDFNLYLLIFFHLILALSFDMSFDLSIPIRRENFNFCWIMHKENRRESSQKSHDIYYWVVKRQRICWQNLSLIWFGNENNDNEENCALMRSALFIFVVLESTGRVTWSLMLVRIVRRACLFFICLSIQPYHSLWLKGRMCTLWIISKADKTATLSKRFR